MPKGKLKRAGASIGIMGILLGAGNHGGGLLGQASSTARNTYTSSRNTQRDTQSRAVRSGSNRRSRGSGQR